MFSRIFLALCLMTGPQVAYDVYVVKENGQVNDAKKVGGTKLDWTIDGNFIRNNDGKVVGVYGVDEACGRLLR